jgi:hypothetical protein
MSRGFYIMSAVMHAMWNPTFTNDNTGVVAPLYQNELGGWAIDPVLGQYYTMHAMYESTEGEKIHATQKHIWYYVKEYNRYVHSTGDMEFTKE